MSAECLNGGDAHQWLLRPALAAGTERVLGTGPWSNAHKNNDAGRIVPLDFDAGTSRRHLLAPRVRRSEIGRMRDRRDGLTRAFPRHSAAGGRRRADFTSKS
jgi:hypothetical protein